MCCCVCVVLQTSSESQLKKLEEQLSEANRRGDDLQRALTELSVAKNRLTGTVKIKRQVEITTKYLNSTYIKEQEERVRNVYVGPFFSHSVTAHYW